MANPQAVVVSGQQVQLPSMKEGYIPICLNQPTALAYEPVVTGNCALPPQLLANVPAFYGKDDENPHLFLQDFFDLCRTQHISGLPAEGVRLLLFPFALKDETKLWYKSLTPGSIHTWEDLAIKFLKQFFPAAKTKQIRRNICQFQQEDDDRLCEAWAKFKRLLNDFPHHQIDKRTLVESFYDGLDDFNRNLVDSATQGNFVALNPNEAWEKFEQLSENNQQFSHRRNSRSKNVSFAQDNDKYARLEEKFDKLLSALSTPLNQEACSVCSETGHNANICPLMSNEQVNYVSQGNYPPKNDPYSSTYNPGWRNHPNFRWRNDDVQQNGPLGFQAGPNSLSNAAPQSKSLEELIGAFVTKTNAMVSLHSKSISSLEQQVGTMGKQMSLMERQLGQIAASMTQRDQGMFPSQVVISPKNTYEQVHAVTLRSGKELRHHPKHSLENKEEEGPDKDVPPPGEPLTSSTSYVPPKGAIAIDPRAKVTERNNTYVPIDVTSIPFPRRFMQAQKDILDIFKKVQVNIPLLDAIKQIPSYAKFLKDLCTNKRRFKEYEIVALSEEVSAVLQRKLPPKLKDPGSFTIPCMIGSIRFDKALLELGASINLMPFSVYEALNIGELQDTNVSIQFADRSMKYPRGIIEDVLVKVNGLILPADFFVLDMEDASMPNSLPLILGRPFMATTRTKIDVFAGTLSMTVLGDTVEFKIFDPSDKKECFSVDTLDSIGQSTFDAPVNKDPLEKSPTFLNEDREGSTEGRSTQVVALEATPSYIWKPPLPFGTQPMSNEKLVRSIVQAPRKELIQRHHRRKC